MGVPFRAGRDFDARDTPSSPRAAIVNETFAHQLLGQANPVGRTFQVEQNPGDPDPVYEVVGLVKDTKYRDLREASSPIVFVAVAQHAHFLESSLDLVVRSSATPGGLAADRAGDGRG
jgi:hypothetical protein